jgi:hypothetical protein
MDFAIPALPFAGSMLVGMLICLDIGRRIGARWLAKTTDGAKPTFSGIESSVFALYGLLLAFTFSGAPARLDARRHLIADEANVISNAYLRLDLLSPDSQPAMRQRFRDYVDARLATYAKLPDIEAAEAELAKCETLQREIWTETLAAAAKPGSHPDAAKLLIPALNQMIDITTTRTTTAKIHPPFVIFALLFLLALVCSLLAGFGMATNARRSWLHIGSYALVAAITVFAILEIEYPRLGLLPVEVFHDKVLVNVRNSMN